MSTSWTRLQDVATSIEALIEDEVVAEVWRSKQLGRPHPRPVTIAFVGKTKSGKSTLLNALLGCADLLPTGPTPTSRVPVIIGKSTASVFDFCCRDDHRQVSDLETLKKLIRNANETNITEISAIEIGLQSFPLDSGIVLDIPESTLNEDFDRLPEITSVQQINAVVYVIQAATAGDADDIDNLVRLSEEVGPGNVFLVFSRSAALSFQDREKLRRFVLSLVEPPEPLAGIYFSEIIPTQTSDSVLPDNRAEQNGLVKFKEELSKYVAERGHQVVWNTSIRWIGRYARRQLGLWQAEIQQIEGSLTVLDEDRRNLGEEIARFEKALVRDFQSLAAEMEVLKMKSRNRLVEALLDLRSQATVLVSGLAFPVSEDQIASLDQALMASFDNSIQLLLNEITEELRMKLEKEEVITSPPLKMKGLQESELNSARARSSAEEYIRLFGDVLEVMTLALKEIDKTLTGKLLVAFGAILKHFRGLMEELAPKLISLAYRIDSDGQRTKFQAALNDHIEALRVSAEAEFLKWWEGQLGAVLEVAKAEWTKVTVNSTESLSDALRSLNSNYLEKEDRIRIVRASVNRVAEWLKELEELVYD